jgi:hypothetical protein
MELDMSGYYEKLKSAKNAVEFNEVLRQEQDARARQRMAAQKAKLFDNAIARYGLNFCLDLGQYASTKARHGGA